MKNLSGKWFVLYTRSRHEKKVMHELNVKNIEGFLPTIKVLSAGLERRRYVDIPLFPSYVFVQLSDRDSYFRTLEIEGVLYYLRMGREIASIDEDIIRKLRVSTTETVSSLVVTSEMINPGTNLMITAGPFSGFFGEVIQHKGRNKIIVRIDLLRRSILMDLCIEAVTTH